MGSLNHARQFEPMNRHPITLEICIDSVDGAVAAARGGADRLELCSALSEGGITPSYGLVRQVTTNVDLPVMMMIRCRGGSFVYSERELAVMRDDIDAAKSLGVRGVVFGVLTRDGSIDLLANQRLVEAARPLEVTFHRAFDEPGVDAQTASRTLEQLGVERLLTSGQQNSAVEGADLIAKIVSQRGNVTIMPGAGVRPENVAELIRATGAREIHGTASRFCGELQRRITCTETVRAIRIRIDSL